MVSQSKTQGQDSKPFVYLHIPPQEQSHDTSKKYFVVLAAKTQLYKVKCLLSVRYQVETRLGVQQCQAQGLVRILFLIGFNAGQDYCVQD